MSSLPPTPPAPSLAAASDRRPRQLEQQGRQRGESRSSSVPVIVRAPREADDTHASTRVLARTRPHSRAPSPSPPSGATEPSDRGASGNRRSVKHLTCFWWWEKGECRYSEDECLYSHHYTGRLTAAPRQVNPGEPARAGRSLERALSELAVTNRSSASLPAPTATLGSRTEQKVSSSTNTNESQPDEPARSRSLSPTTALWDPRHTADLVADNEFFRGLVLQNQREKQVLMDAVDGLQKDKSSLQRQVEAMSTERAALLTEREALQATVRRLQFGNTHAVHTVHATHTSLMRPQPQGLVPVASPWGAIGSGRSSSAELAPSRVTSAPEPGYDNASRHNTPSPATAAALNPTAQPYGGSNGHFDGGNRTYGGDVADFGSVLRNLGPSF